MGRLPISDRFWSHVSKTSSCWNWVGALHRNGYGKFGFSNTKTTTAHRMAWQLTFGWISQGKCVLHQCDNRRCVNPSHLFLGSQKDNIQDALKKGRLVASGAKLTSLQVLEIRSLLTGRYGEYTRLGREYGVCSDTISLIANNKIWKETLAPLAQGICEVEIEAEPQ